MELNVVKKTKNKLKLEIDGETHTFCNALKKEIWKDEAVKATGYDMKHSLISLPILIVETENKIPQTVLSDAVKRLKRQNSGLLAQFKKV